MVQFNYKKTKELIKAKYGANSVKQIAEKLGVSRAMFFLYITEKDEKRADMPLSLFLKMSTILDCEVYELLEANEEFIEVNEKILTHRKKELSSTSNTDNDKLLDMLDYQIKKSERLQARLDQCDCQDSPAIKKGAASG